MKICSTVNPSTAREIGIDIFGSRGLHDRCLCLNYSTDTWKILFSGDLVMLMLKKKASLEESLLVFQLE